MKKCYICGKESEHKLCSKRCLQVVIMRHRIRVFKEDLVMWTIFTPVVIVWIYLAIKYLRALP